MASSATSTRRSELHTFIAPIVLGGQEFAFRLCTRPLALGPGRLVQYYWMDSSQFRIARGRRATDPSNFRNCVSHWWWTIQSQELERDPDQIRHLLLATAYALVSSGKSLQHVYRDAHLAPKATSPEERSLPDCICERIQVVVSSRDSNRVRDELDEVLGRVEVADAEVAGMRQTGEGILQYGVELVERRGEDGLVEFLAKFDAWCSKRRKKGGQGWLRRFLDVFTYECKVSFYLCYANVWNDLIPWLRQHRNLDKISERFLLFWHMQNQPIELTDGQVITDVFRGQVLSLHPLSGFLMKDPALRNVAGRFFASERYEEAMLNGLTEYWEFVGAVLIAANLYRQASDDQTNLREVRRQGGDALDHQPAPAEDSEALLLEDFAQARNLTCPDCKRPLRLVRFHPATTDDVFRVDYVCGSCDRPVETTFDRATFSQWLSAND